MERDLITPEWRSHFAPPKHNRSRDGGLPVGQGAGEGRNLGVFTPRFVRVAGLSLNLWVGANLQIPVF